MAPIFVLASASAARRQLLEKAGILVQVRPSQFDESVVQSTQPSELVETLAHAKARVVAQQDSDPALILGCDSVFEIDGKIYGKPEGPENAIARWKQMRGRVGNIFTGHALIDLYQNLTVVRSQVTRIRFAHLSDYQIEAYVKTDEPIHCAGSFALDGRGGFLVEEIDGCHSNVIGLSLPLLRQMLETLGYDVADFW